MLLRNAASFFDKTPCTDAYTGDFVFNAQMGLYDDTKRDTEAAERRIISTTADVTIPARRVVEMLGSRYILGKANPDVFNGAVIRLGHVAHEAYDLASILTLKQASLGEPGVDAYAAHAWVKNKAFTEQDSNLTPEFHMFFASTEVVAKNNIIDYQGGLYIVRAKNVGATQIIVVTAEQIDNVTFETAQVRSGYDPVQGTFNTDETPVRMLRIRWQALFDYGTSLSAPFGPDEQQFIVAKTEYVVGSGAQFSLPDGLFKITAVASEGDVWICRVVKHAGV